MISESEPKVSCCLQFGSLSIRKLTPPTVSSSVLKFNYFADGFFLEIHIIYYRNLKTFFYNCTEWIASYLKQIDLRFKITFYLGRV